jgi:hypothetical protein
VLLSSTLLTAKEGRLLIYFIFELLFMSCSSRQKIFKVLISLPELVIGIYENWENLISTTLIAGKVTYLIVMHASSYITECQWMTIIYGTESALHVHEKPTGLCVLKHTRTGQYLYQKVQQTLLQNDARKNENM